MLFKKEISDIHAARDEYEEAAKVLETINLKDTNRNIRPADVVGIWLDIADYWFEADDSVNAEKFVN
jgi:hypothetical protein